MTRARLLDVLVAVAVGVGGLAVLIDGADLEAQPELIVLNLLVAAPVSLRSTRPLWAVALSGAAIVCSAVLDDLGVDNVAYAFAVLLCAYSTGSHLPRRRALYGLGLALAVMFAMAGLLEQREIGNFFFGPIFLALIPWGVGRAVRHRAELSRQLAEQAEELRRTREQSAALAVQEERTRIARDLHDTVAHAVAAMVVQASAGRRALDRDVEQAIGTAHAIESTGRDALDELRRLLGVMRRGDEDLALAPQPTLDRIGELVERSRQVGLDVDLRVEGEPCRLAQGAELAAYRIVQESLANVLLHARGAAARVVVCHGVDEVTIEVTDGGGAVGRANGAGRGLAGMRERVALFGGDLEAGPANDGGWTVRARLPRDMVEAER